MLPRVAGCLVPERRAGEGATETEDQRSFPRRGPRPPSPPANSRLRLETLSEAFAATIITPHQAELGLASRPGRGASGRGRHRSRLPPHRHTHTAGGGGSAFATGESWELLSAEPARKSSRAPGAACGADARLAMSGRPGRAGEAGHPAWTGLQGRCPLAAFARPALSGSRIRSFIGYANVLRPNRPKLSFTQ